MQHKWLQTIRSSISNTGHLLDLGGVTNAEYHRFLPVNKEQIIIWNLAPDTKPNAIVDLDEVAAYPRFPENCHTILAFNLLEHLYRPLDLITWAAMPLPSGGNLLISVPFIYPIHPSPSDYWRMTPELFERFFSELKKTDAIEGKLEALPLSEDLRDTTVLVTSTLFKSHALHRLLAMCIEGFAKFISAVASTIGFSGQIRMRARTYPSAIGVVSTKK